MLSLLHSQLLLLLQQAIGWPYAAVLHPFTWLQSQGSTTTAEISCRKNTPKNGSYLLAYLWHMYINGFCRYVNSRFSCPGCSYGPSIAGAPVLATFTPYAGTTNPEGLPPIPPPPIPPGPPIPPPPPGGAPTVMSNNRSADDPA